ncbi:MAG: hypothetical protein LC798_16955 [Chloroflexi bacterium]|nr:hypothetical protein [Chloroflexota bacterium]
MPAAEADLTGYQADQLRRLCEHVQLSQANGTFACVFAQGAREDDAPLVWRQLRDLGLVTLSISEGEVRVTPVREEVET